MAPLGIVGSLSKSLFGLITEDDAELITKNIDRLFHDQSALVKLSEQKTHLLSARLEELYSVSKPLPQRNGTKIEGENQLYDTGDEQEQPTVGT